MADVSKLQVVVGADTREAESALGRLTDTISSGFGIGIGIKLVEGGLNALSAGLRSSVGEAASFEQRLSAIKAVSGATADEMERMSALALQLGADTSFSAGEAAKGIEELVKGGVALTDIMGGAAKASLDLAAAGEISVADAATIAANAMAQFGIKGSDMAHVADLIAGAANASALDVGQFKFSLQAAGAVAATVGFTFDDLAQAIAVMGKAGITGSDAGTSLKTMMMSLQPSTKAAKELMMQLGIVTADGANAFFDASGKVKSMAQVAEVLQNATAKMTAQQKLATLETLFGSDAIRAAAVLAKEGAEGFTSMAEAMGKVTAASVAEQRLDNLTGSLEKLKGSLSTMAITVGTVLLKPLKQLVDYGTELVNAWTPTIQSFAQKIPGAIEKVVATVRTFLGQVGPPLLAFGAAYAKTVYGIMAPAIQYLIKLWPRLTAALVSASKYATKVVLPAIAQLSKWLQQRFTAALKVVLPIVTSVAGWLRQRLGAALTWLTKTGWPMLTKAVSVSIAWIRTTALPVLSSVWTWLSTNLRAGLTWLTQTGWPLLTSAIASAVGYVRGVLVPALAAAWDWLAPKLQEALTWLTATGWPMLVGAAGVAIGWLQTTAIPVLTGVWSWLSEKVGVALRWLTEVGWPYVQEAAASALDWLQTEGVSTLRTAWTWLSDRFKAALDWLINQGWPMLQAAAATVVGWFTGTLIPKVKELWEWLSPIFQRAFNWLVKDGWPMLQNAAGLVVAWFTSTLIPELTRLYNWLYPKLETAFNWLKSTGWPMAQLAATTFWSFLTTVLVPKLEAVWKWLYPKLEEAFNWLKDTGWPMAQAAAGIFWAWLNGTLVPKLVEMWQYLGPKLKIAMDYLVSEGWPRLKEAAGLLADKIKDLGKWAEDLHLEFGNKRVYEDLKGLWGDLQKLGSDLMSKLFHPMTNAVGDMTDQFDGMNSSVSGIANSVSTFVKSMRVVVEVLSFSAKMIGMNISALKYMGEVAIWAARAAGKVVTGGEAPAFPDFSEIAVPDFGEAIGKIDDIVRSQPTTGSSNRRIKPGTPLFGGGTGGGSWFTGGGGALPGETPVNPGGGSGSSGGGSGGGGGSSGGGGMPTTPIESPYRLPLNSDTLNTPVVTNWGGLIEQMGQKYGVPASVIASIMQIESNGINQTSKLPNRDEETGEWWGKAIGLMQIVPFLNTHLLPKSYPWLDEDGNFKVKLDNKGELDPAQQSWLMNEERNIELGTKKLAQLFNHPKVGRDWVKAASAYFGAFNFSTGQVTNAYDVQGGSGESYRQKFRNAMKRFGGENLLAYANGGWISEPVLGVGRSGQRYLLGESGPEYVTPARSMAPSSMSVPIVIGGRVIEELWITGRDLAVRRGRVPVGATI